MSKPKHGIVNTKLADQRVRPTDRRRLKRDRERDEERSTRRGGKLILGAPATDAEAALLEDDQDARSS